jgi:hypothetical protein
VGFVFAAKVDGAGAAAERNTDPTKTNKTSSWRKRGLRIEFPYENRYPDPKVPESFRVWIVLRRGRALAEKSPAIPRGGGMYRSR